MNKLMGSLLVATFSAMTVSSAWACPPMHEGRPCGAGTTDMDANKDGFVSQKEFIAYHNRQFKQLDTNKDGRLSQDEMQAIHAKMHAHGDTLISKRFEGADTDHDGAISREEAKDMPMLLQNFDEIDVNKDGKVTPEEIKALMAAHRAKAAESNSETASEKK